MYVSKTPKLVINYHFSLPPSSLPPSIRLTVDTMMTTQAPTQHHSDEEEGTGVGFMARDDASRYSKHTYS